MKKELPFYKKLRYGLILYILACSPTATQAQGRVLINEYLPWPNNACGTTAEFIELFNFGPGPMNVGCYIITDGDFSITIPANTILQPGQYYVLAGQATIPQNCGNDLRNVTVDLNWATCGCTSGAIPTTGDGLLTDGGSGNEQIVLLNPNLQVVDAVIRDFPAESSSAITTSSMGGLCTPKTFDLDTMSIVYETIGESTGRGNSMARERDGGCKWIKDTQESAGDDNNTSSSGTSIDATLTVTNTQTCTNTGSAVISVHSGDMSQLFPMHYILAKDVDSNNSFNFLDSYTYAADSSASTIPINSLTPGRYEVVMGSAKGCDLTPFNFVILNCNNIVLPLTTPGTAISGRQTSNTTVSVKTFPNPVLEQLIVRIVTRQRGEAQLVLTDNHGRLIYRYATVLLKGENTISLPARQLQHGIYFLRAFHNQFLLSPAVKVVK